MAKVKKESKSAENISKTPKKSHGPIQSIKSPKHRKKSADTPLKTKKTKDLSHLRIKEANNADIPIKVHKKSKAKQNTSITGSHASAFEDKFNIKIEGIKIAIETVVRLRKENPKIKNQLFEDEAFPISLKVSCHRIPSGFQKILRIPLAHTLVSPDDDICLIVSEVNGIGNKEHDKHIEHYEDLFAKKGVEIIKKIMTVHELKTEYETYEQKRRLVDLYDHFLVCAKVSGKVVKKCGKLFYNRRKVPAPVKLQVTKLKEHIDKTLSRAYFHLHTQGDSYFVDFGNSTMDISNLLDNFISIVEFLDKEFPGGFNNIKGLLITCPRTPSVPVYISTTNPNEIPKVKVQAKNKFVQKTIRGELTTKLHSEVIVRPSGQVTVINRKKTKRAHEGDSNSEVPKKKKKQDKIVETVESEVQAEESVSKKIKKQKNKKKEGKNVQNGTVIVSEEKSTKKKSLKKKEHKAKESINNAENNLKNGKKAMKMMTKDTIAVEAEENVSKKIKKHKNKKNEGKNVQNGTEIVPLEQKASKKKAFKKKEHKAIESINNAENNLKIAEKALKKKIKETIGQSEVNLIEEVTKNKKKKAQRVMHLNNLITIEDLSVTPEKKVKNTGKMNKSKTTVKQGGKKLKIKKENL